MYKFLFPLSPFLRHFMPNYHNCLKDIKIINSRYLISLPVWKYLFYWVRTRQNWTFCSWEKVKHNHITKNMVNFFKCFQLIKHDTFIPLFLVPPSTVFFSRLSFCKKKTVQVKVYFLMWIFFHDKSFNTIHYPLDSHNLEKYKLHAVFCTLKSYLKGKLDYKQFSMFLRLTVNSKVINHI